MTTIDKLTEQISQNYELLKSKNDKAELDLNTYSMMRHEIGNIANSINIIPVGLCDLFDFDSKLEPKDYDILSKKSENINKLLRDLMKTLGTCQKPERIKDDNENSSFPKEVINYFKCINDVLTDKTSQYFTKLNKKEPIIHNIISSSGAHINKVFNEIENEFDEIENFIDENYDNILASFEDEESKNSFKEKRSQITQNIHKSIHIARYTGETMLSLFDESTPATSEFDLKDLIDFTLSAYEIQDKVNFNFTNELTASAIKSHEGLVYHALSNAIKNAYEAQSNLPEDVMNNYVTINVTENSENHSILINITNTGVPPLKTFEKPGKSSKDARTHRGLGTYVISRAIEKLGGTHKYVVDDTDKTTTLKIELPYNSK